VNSVRDRIVAPYIQVVHPDTISILSIIVAVVLGVGLSAAAGFRVFVPLLGAGIAVRLGWLTPGASLDWVGSTPALVAFGLACLVELTGSLIPAVDHAIDAIAAPMSAAAGSILMAVQMCDQLGLGVSEQLAGMDGARELSPLVLWSIAIIVGGGLALGTHAAAAAGRAGSTLTTAGLANPIYATAESFTSVVATVVAIALPACCLIMAIPAIVVVTPSTRRASFGKADPTFRVTHEIAIDCLETGASAEELVENVDLLGEAVLTALLSDPVFVTQFEAITDVDEEIVLDAKQARQGLCRITMTVQISEDYPPVSASITSFDGVDLEVDLIEPGGDDGQPDGTIDAAATIDLEGDDT
jgi:hypothetical protein